MGKIKDVLIVAEEIMVELIDRLDGNPDAVDMALDHINRTIGSAPVTDEAGA